MMLARRGLLAVSLFLLLASAAMAKPNFTGSWKMNPAKSNFGQVPQPEKMERTVDHKDPALLLKSLQVRQDKEVKTEANLSTDGKEFTVKTQFGDMKGTAKWDGDALVVESKLQIQGNEITQSDRWVLAAGGKELKVDSVLNTPQGEVKLTIIYDKQ